MEHWECRAGGTSAYEGRGRLRASQAEREQAIETLKAAFVQGRLDTDEFGARVDQALTSKTRAELTAVTADLPAAPAAVQPAPARPGANTVGVRVLAVATAVAAASWAGAGSGPAAVMLALTLTIVWLGIAILTASVMLESRRQTRATGTLPPHGPSGRTSLGY